MVIDLTVFLQKGRNENHIGNCITEYCQMKYSIIIVGHSWVNKKSIWYSTVFVGFTLQYVNVRSVSNNFNIFSYYFISHTKVTRSLKIDIFIHQNKYVILQNRNLCLRSLLLTLSLLGTIDTVHVVETNTMIKKQNSKLLHSNVWGMNLWW